LIDNYTSRVADVTRVNELNN